MDNTLNRSVIKAAGEIFSNYLGWDIKGRIPVERPINESYKEVSVIISFVGSISGAITMKCSKKLATEIASGMLGTEVEKDSDDMKDAVGELLNMIIGAAKNYYSSGVDPFKISVPTIVIGEDYVVHIKASNKDKISLLDFLCNQDGMSMEIFLE